MKLSRMAKCIIDYMANNRDMNVKEVCFGRRDILYVSPKSSADKSSDDKIIEYETK